MNKKTVSLCMIVKDEEIYLRRCLESVITQVDEIVIVDTGSTDSTLNIAEEFGAKIFKFVWEEDFAAARNYSVKNAKSDYVLVLDADEYLDENIRIQETLDEQKDYYIINFKNYMDGGYISNHQAIRLFKNNIGLKYYGKIHEHLNIDDFENLTLAFSDFIIHHDGYKKETYTSKNKFDRNFKILMKEVNDNPTGYNLFNLGVQLKVSGKYDEAITVLKQSFPLSKDQIYLPYLLYLMGECLLELGRNKDGIHLIKDSIEIFPDYTGFYYLKGLFYEKLNYLESAEETFGKCLELGEVKYFQSIEGVGSYLAFIKLSEIQQKQGKLTASLDSSFSALNLHRTFTPALNQYFSVMKSAGISENDIDENLKTTFPIYNMNNLEIVVKVLYVNRSKLLQQYIDDYKVNADNSVLAISALYNKRYPEARSFWMNEDKLNPEVFSDIVGLCLVEKNKELYLKVLNNMNLNKREKKTMVSLIEDSTDTQVLLPLSLFDTIKNSSLCLLKLEEEDAFLKLFKKVKFNDYEKEKMISLLVQNGYLKLSADLLLEEIKINKQSYRLMGLLGDIYIRQNKLNDALNLYTKLVEEIGDYSSYNRLFNLYQKIGYHDGVKTAQEEMRDKINQNLMIISKNIIN